MWKKIFSRPFRKEATQTAEEGGRIKLKIAALPFEVFVLEWV